MAKTARSKKQKSISVFNLPIGKIKKGVKATPHRSTSKLRNTKKVAKALAECLINGDVDSFKEVLNAHINILENKRDFSKKVGIGRATLYEALSPNGNPSLETVAKIVHSLGV